MKNNCTVVRRFLIAVIFYHVTSSVSFGQIQGPSPVGGGTTQTYSFDNGVLYIKGNWQVAMGTINSSTKSGTLCTVNITWQTCGTTGLVTFRDLTTVISMKDVIINGVTPPDPATTFSVSNICRSSTITRTTNPPAGVDWYWQTSTTGTDFSNLTSTLTTASSGIYYLRAYSCGTWSAAALATSHIIVINPGAPTTTPVTRCGAGPVTLTASTTTLSDNINWYDAPSGGNFLGTGTSLALSNVSSTTTYYASGLHTSTNCESTTRTPLTVTINPIPALSNLPASVSICGSTALNFTPTATPSGGTFTWTSSISGTISAGSVSASGSGAITNTPVNTGNANGTVTYAVTPSLNSCNGTTQNYTVTVKPIPTVGISTGPTICSGVAASLTISNPNGVSGTTFSWTQVATNVTGASNGTGASISQTLTNTSTVQGTVVYTATAAANGCNSTTAASTATVKPIPQITNTAPQLAIESCSASALNFTPTSSIAGTTYAWTSSATAGITGNSASGSGAITNTLTNSSSVTAGTATYVIVPSLNSCSGTAKNYVVTVVPKPVITLTGSATLVYGTSTQLSTTATAAIYNWKLNSTNISGATTSSFRVGQIGTYTIGIKNTVSSIVECVSAGTILNTAAQSYPVNFVSTTRILKEGVAATASPYTLNPEELAQTIAYQDGIGRTFQTVGVGLSTEQTDLISQIAYGKQGLVDTTFLPYATGTKNGLFRLNAIRTGANPSVYIGSEQHAFYQTEVLTAHDAQPLARTISRTAPDARVIEQGAPGIDWQPAANHTVKSTITVNTATYPVRYWTAGGTTDRNYLPNSVVVSITTDENGNKVRTYTNKFGQTVLKQVQLDENINSIMVNWLETYYIYDVYGRLAYQLPPKAMSVLGTGGTLDANNSLIAELIYKYIYDAKGRLVEKKVPGAVLEYIVYDKLNRVVLTQDGNLRATNEWMFVKYDYLNRSVYSGLYKNTTQITRPAVQALLDGIDYGVSPRFETEQASTPHGYSNAVFPRDTDGSIPLKVLSVNYYDHYNFDRALGYDYKYDSLHLTGIPNTRNMNIRGLSTGGKKAIIDATGAVTGWLISAIFYDQYERPIQTQSNNHLNLTVQDKSSVIYDFVRATKSKTTHVGPTTVNIVRRYTFDHAGRTLGVYQTIDALPEQQVAAFTYNRLGQLIDKKLHNTGGSNFLQSIDYRYNIRGWLTSINNSQLTNDGTINDDSNDLFGMEMNYNVIDAGIANAAFYNGNISAIKWKGPGISASASDNQRSFKYAYDKTDRLKTSTFQGHNGTNWTKEANTLNESMSYDHNGNILSLNRNQNQRGLSGVNVTSTPQTIDNLTYTYTSNQNQLAKVEDAGTSIGFNNGVNTGIEYLYAVDGSLIRDDNKGISGILYNPLGKPSQITFSDGRAAAYTYASDGSKLKMAVTVSGVTTTTDYVGGFVYTNNALSFFGSPDGRVVKNGSVYEYQYAIGDHQGNTRVIFSSATPAPYAPIATWEGDAGDNSSQYSNIVSGNVVSFVAANHTPSGTKALRMNQTNKIQATKSVAVYPGDKIDLEVWEYHEGNSGFGTTSTPLTTLITNVAGAFGGVSGAPDISGSIYSGVNSAITNIGTGGNQGASRPAAYLNYILFDKNYKVLNAGWQLAPGTTFTKQKLSFATIDIKEAGFIFVWLSYDDDSNNWVYFDDLKVTHTKNNIIQYNEYYPFGMQAATSWTRENVTGNNFLANGGTELNNTSSLYDLEYRNYDPVLGRMHQVDPLADNFSSLTPYNFSFNDPVAFTDPNGAAPGEPDHANPNAWWKYLGPVASNPGYGAGLSRQFGVSMTFGALSYSDAGRAYASQMAEDAKTMDADEYAEKYGESGSYRITDYYSNGDRDRYIDTKISFVTTSGLVRSFSWNDRPSENNTSSYCTSCSRSGTYNGTNGSGPSPWQVGREWLTGTGPRHRDFTNGDQFTEMLRQHDHVEATRGIIRNNIINGGELTGRAPYDLGGIEGVGKYLKDYSTLLTGGLTGNLAVTYLGSYGLNWQVTAVNGNLATIMFTVDNSSTIQSAFRPPVIGYTDAWQSTAGAWLNSQFSSGPMSPTTQTIRWTETITIK